VNLLSTSPQAQQEYNQFAQMLNGTFAFVCIFKYLILALPQPQVPVVQLQAPNPPQLFTIIPPNRADAVPLLQPQPIEMDLPPRIFPPEVPGDKHHIVTQQVNINLLISNSDIRFRWTHIYFAARFATSPRNMNLLIQEFLVVTFPGIYRHIVNACAEQESDGWHKIQGLCLTDNK
jgi:hypothetical protein